VAASIAVAHDRWPVCFPRRETGLTCRNMIEAMLMVTESANCWSLGEAISHRGPHVLHHFLSRARWDHDTTRDRLATWAIDQLGTESVALIVDETGDEKSSTDTVCAAHQYSGALGGVGLCQVAVHLSYATTTGHTLIDRRLFLPEAWAADEERRELTGVPNR
jgi:SRSO17 transposase